MIDLVPMNMRKTVSLVAINAALLLSTHAAWAQFAQQGPKLEGAGAVGAAFQGYSVSISADGNTAIIGGPYDNNQGGAAWVWTRSGGVWTQQGNKLVGSGAVENANQGESVSLSGDGNTAIIGAPGGGGDGAAFVWTRIGVTWTQQGSKLVGSGAVNACQGTSVSIASDGNTVIVGGYCDQNSGGQGAAWVWTRSGDVWTQQGNKLVGSGAVGNSTRQGFSVRLSGDGNTAIVGGDCDNFTNDRCTGAAWVWTRSGGVWNQQGNKLVGHDPNTFHQGNSVSLSADGNTAIIGAPSGVPSPAAYVWTRSGAIWTEERELVNPVETGIGFGFSVSLSADGNTALVSGVNGEGGAWVWTRTGGVWTQGPNLVGASAAGSAYGWSISLSADGNTAIVGGWQDNNRAGGAWVFASEPVRRRAARH